MNATSWQADFKRRTDVNSAPAYMLADVTSTAAPDPLTFVVHLKDPVSAFLDYLAAPYGPKAVSPAILTAHAGKDFAQNWLKDHDAGTGPFTITKFTTDVGYELTRFDGYWGTPKPYFEKVEISIIPDITTQRLKLESGELDLMTHGLPIADVESFRTNPKFQVHDFPVALEDGARDEPAQGVRSRTGRSPRRCARSSTSSAIVKEVYKTQAAVSTQMYPVQNLPAELAMDTSTSTTPSTLTNLAKSLPASDKNIDFAYSQDEGGTLPRLAEVLAAKLQAAGLQREGARPADRRGVRPPEPPREGARPAAVDVQPRRRAPRHVGPDLHELERRHQLPEVLRPGGRRRHGQGPPLGHEGRRPEVLRRSRRPARRIGLLHHARRREPEIVVARKGLTGFVHQLPTAYTIRLKDLKEG